jgi:very-short-patch-repair endonuclease
MAAVLACGKGAVLSHRSAAALWDLRPAPASVDVTVSHGGAIPRREKIDVHATRSLEPAEITARHGIPCTSVARTLLDLASVVTSRVLDRALEQSMMLRLYDHRSVIEVLERANGRRGAGVLRRSLVRLTDEPPDTRSELERRLLELIRDSGLPRPVVNIRIAGYEVDICWPDKSVIVEADGRRTHGTPQAFERDRQRDLELTNLGWRVIRITWRQVAERPEQIVATVRRLLGTNAARGGAD